MPSPSRSRPRAQKSAVAHLPGQSTNQHALPRNQTIGIFAAISFPATAIFNVVSANSGKNQRGDPKPHDHFRFAPTEQFEMVMMGAISKNALCA